MKVVLLISVNTPERKRSEMAKSKILFAGSVLLLILTIMLCVSTPGGAADASPAKAADFEGKWHGSPDNQITITNVTEKSFEFSFLGFSGAHIGELQGVALFVAENKAVFNYDDNDKTVKFEFVINNGVLSVSVAEGDETGLFGTGVYMNGEYSKIL